METSNYSMSTTVSNLAIEAERGLRMWLIVCIKIKIRMIAEMIFHIIEKQVSPYIRLIAYYCCSWDWILISTKSIAWRRPFIIIFGVNLHLIFY